MSCYTNYQVPPNYGYQQQQYQQHQYQQQQYHQQPYPSQYPQYMQMESNDSYYSSQAPAPVSAPLPSYGYQYQQPSSPVPSLHSASTTSSYSTPSAGSSDDDLFGMFSSPSPLAQTTTQNMAPRPVTPENTRQMSRPASNEDLQAVIAAQERALVQSKQKSLPRSFSPAIVERKDYVVPRDIKGKRIISDAIHPEKYEMKKTRKQHTVAGATSGAIVGGLLAGPAFPIGMAVGGAVGGYASNKMHKMQERRRQRRHEQRNFQKAAKNTAVARSEFVAFV